MKSLFGVVSLSLATVVDTIREWTEKHEKVFCLLDSPSKLKRALRSDIVVLPNMKAFKDNIEALNKSLACVIVADNPLVLNEIEEVVFLDATSLPGKSYRLTLCKPKWNLVYKSVLSKNKNVQSYTTKDFDLIPNLINNQTFSDFLDTYQNLMYRVFDTIKRNTFQPILFNRIFTGNDKAFKKACIKFAPKRGYAKVQWDSLLSKVEGEYGSKLTSALSLAATNKNYKQVAKKCGVDVFDLRFLIKSNSKLGKKPVGNISDILKDTVARNNKRLESLGKPHQKHTIKA